MKVSLDGGVTFVDAPNGILVVYEDVSIPGEDDDGEVHINLTHEGIVIDVWVSRDESLDYNIATDSVTIDEKVSRMIEEDS